jgi:hypothetical protein
MKTMVLAYIGMLLSSLVLTSYMCCGVAPVITTQVITGNWDNTGYNTVSIDSGKSPVASADFDTSYAPHQHNSYQLKGNDSVIYTDYTVVPNIVLAGTYALIDTGYTAVSGHLVLHFPSAAPDTISFQNNSSELLLLYTTYGPHGSSQLQDIYTRY